MKFSLAALLLPFLASGATAILNGPCTVGSTPGVCVTDATCSSGGGISHSGYCPRDAANIRCCTKPSCSSGAGNCRWTEQCGGSSVTGQCPGPSGFKCCTSGSIITPSIPTSNCKSHVVSAGRTILAQFPSAVHTVWCYANKAGDHGQGLALDLMVGAYNAVGERIAIWAMNNHSSLRIKYIIWGQKIWNIQVDGAPKSWANWRGMEDRGSYTANHWDHPHISFFA